MEDLTQISQSVVRLEPYAEYPGREIGIKSLAKATGFIWEKNGSYFLVSNWHVFTGRNHDTGDKLDIAPKYLKISSAIGENSVVVNLRDEIEKPLWLQALRTKGDLENVPEFDIAILALKNSVNDLGIQPLNISLQVENSLKDITLEVTTRLSVVGYPLEVKSGANIPPIWVTAYVASSPLLNESLFYSNGFPYSGMSGSPVFWVFPNRPVKLKSGGVMVNAVSGNFVQFVGVYSGRMYGDAIIDDKVIKQPIPIARIWKAALIDEILKGFNDN